jgi:hypothetical protein
MLAKPFSQRTWPCVRPDHRSEAAECVAIGNFKEHDELLHRGGNLTARGKELKALQFFEIADRFDQALDQYARCQLHRRTRVGRVTKTYSARIF